MITASDFLGSKVRVKTTQLLGFAARCKLASPTTITIILGTSFSANIFQHDLYLRQGVLQGSDPA